MELPKEKTLAKNDLKKFRALIYGLPKIGKSTFCSQFPKPLFLDCEGGLRFLDTYRIPVNSWEDFEEAYKLISETQHDFQTIIIDTVDKLHDYNRAKIMKDLKIKHESDFGYAKGWSLCREFWCQWVDKIVKLPYCVIFVSHAYKDGEENSAKYRIIPSLTGKEGLMVSSAVDITLYAETATDSKGNNVRVLRTSQDDPRYEAGGRIKFLPKTMPLDYKLFMSYFEKQGEN